MQIDFAPYARIIIRVAAGYLIGDSDNPELEAILMDPAIVGVVALLISEAWYFVAKKSGGTT